MNHRCQVMLREVTDSGRENRRVGNSLHASPGNNPPHQPPGLLLWDELWHRDKNTRWLIGKNVQHRAPEAPTLREAELALPCHNFTKSLHHGKGDEIPNIF